MQARAMPATGLIAICWLVYFLDGLIHSVLGPLAPDMARSLVLTSTQLGPIFSANLIGQCIGLVLLPLVGGSIGQRRVVWWSLVGFGLAQAASALANGATSLFVMRLVTGVFLGGCLPAGLALVTAAAPEKRRGFAIMLLFMGYGLGATLAGIVAAAFAGAGGWRMSMVVVGGACLVTAMAGARWLREPVTEEAVKPEPAAAGVRAVAQIFSRRYLVATLMLWLLFICMLTTSYCLNSWLPTLLVNVGRAESFAAMSVSVFSLGGIVAALGVGVLTPC
jgi:MFS family permease